MPEIKNYFEDAIDIRQIIEPEEIHIAIFCHGAFCRIPLKAFLKSLERFK